MTSSDIRARISAAGFGTVGPEDFGGSDYPSEADFERSGAAALIRARAATLPSSRAADTLPAEPIPPSPRLPLFARIQSPRRARAAALLDRLHALDREAAITAIEAALAEQQTLTARAIADAARDLEG